MKTIGQGMNPVVQGDDRDPFRRIVKKEPRLHVTTTPKGAPRRRRRSSRSCACSSNQDKHALYDGNRLVQQCADSLTPVQTQVLELLSHRTCTHRPSSSSNSPLPIQVSHF